MARVQNPIIGRSSGLLGNAVFSTWKGKNVLRSKALEVHNPQTDAQMQQRTKMAVMVAVYQTIAAIVKQGFKNVAIGMSEYNVFTSINMRNQFLSYDGTRWVADDQYLQISKGNLDVTPISSITTSNGTATVAITFPATAVGDQSVNDKVFALAVKGDDIAYSLGAVSRSAGTLTLTLPTSNGTGDAIDVYLFFRTADGAKTSNSVYELETV